MYLKALELHGFKSFPVKTRLTFDRDVTAIVGPNGSGKSNISDALRWVMGEQSTRALRGGKMEDVIFGGTEKRGPMGFAEVSLVFDNSGHIFNMDSSEVMLTRRYFRSGESEYYINKNQVRLKDISEMLMDTGLGRDGYSIIGQGRIDEILSVRSTDRREIFEEAAGISRFRHRKEESERKLERADENLLRINDKISELEIQVEPLRRQSEIAKRYLILRDELRGLEISAWMDELDRLSSQTKQLDMDCASAAKELAEAKSELDRLYASGEAYFERVKAKETETEKVRTLLAETEASAAETENEAAVARADQRSNSDNIERVKAELEQQEDRDSGILSQIQERETRIGQIAEEKKAGEERAEILNREMAELDARADAEEAAIAAVTREAGEIAVRLSGARATVSALADALQELEDRNAGRLAELNDAEQRLQTAENETRAQTEALGAAQQHREELANLVSGHTLRTESRRRRAEAAAQKKMNLTMELGAMRSRIALLTEMEKDYQGYSKAVKTVMQEAKRGFLRGVHGTIAELVRSDARCTLAVETALGAGIQNIVVSSEADSKAGIELLKRRGGRASFMPMSVVRGSRLTERGLEEEDGFVGIAADLVKFDPQYTGVVTYLLGRTVVSENLDTAVRTARRYGHRFRIVTLDGQVINAGGIMTGGSAVSNAGILSRANELEELAKREKNAAQQAADAEKASEDAQRELTKAEYELSVAADELRRAEDEVLKLEAARLHSSQMEVAVRDGRDSLRAEAETLSRRTAETENQISQTRQTISELEAKAAGLQETAEARSAGFKGLAGRRQELVDELSALRARDASLDAERDAVLRAMDELKTLRRSLSGGRSQYLAALEGYQRRAQELEASIADCAGRLAAIGAQAEGYRRRLSQISQEKLQLEAERTRRDRDIQEKNNLQIQLEREAARLEQKRQAVLGEEKRIVDKLWDSYELSRTAAMGLRQPVENKAETQKRIGEIRREISRMGTPNIGAIEEYERVNTRYTFLTDQRDDVEKARSELLKIIREITANMRSIFAREFTQIAESFSTTFRELFGGGKASLELEDEENILDCGIEIKVQPPGKTLKTITLLSGGEKAFVAIALYFAILKVRPAPFVVMDEIEAALDEANVTRFAQYMRTMADKTQFLVITHRRGTMEEADVLYGVTMQEHGVSQVMRLDLSEAEKTIKA